MANVILYSLHCPKCNILEKKLTSNNIAYVVDDDVEGFNSKGIIEVPTLEVDGQRMDYVVANQWVNGHKRVDEFEQENTK